MRTGMPRQWATAVTVALVAGVAIGVPAGVDLTSFYARMAVVEVFGLGGLIAAHESADGDLRGTAADRAERRPWWASRAVRGGAVRVRCRLSDLQPAHCPASSAPAAWDSAGRVGAADYDEHSLVPEGSHSGGEGSDRASAG